MSGTIKKHLKKMLPSMQIIKSPDTNLVSVRWLKFGVDLISSKGFKFAQYQLPKSKIRWVMVKPRSMKDPLFLYSRGWVINKKFATIQTGLTTKPLDLRKYWRANEDRTRERVQQGNGALKLGW